MGQFLLTDTGRKMFEKAVINGRGRLSANALATLVNAARRETMPELTRDSPRARMRNPAARSRRGGTQHGLSQQGG